MSQPLPAFARVTALRRQCFVEFEYMVGDPDLVVELILPLPAFREFCARVGATIRDDDKVLDGAAIPHRAPGLYRPALPG